MTGSVVGNLAKIAQENNVTILYAVEDGSRAWGFESNESDFDVRFIFRKAPAQAFSLFPGVDVIKAQAAVSTPSGNRPGDFVGWSLSKALRLGISSNPKMMEWGAAPIVYSEAPGFGAELGRLLNESNPRGLAWSYQSLGLRIYKADISPGLAEHCRPEKQFAQAKSYLHAVRSVLAAQWMCENPHPGKAPPILFTELRGQTAVTGRGTIPDLVNAEIETLLAYKTGDNPLSAGRRYPVLDDWIMEEIIRLENAIPRIPERGMDTDVAEAIFARAYPVVFKPEMTPAEKPAHHQNDPIFSPD